MDVNQTYYGDNFAIYANIKSCTPETNICQFTSIKKQVPNEWISV